MSSHYTSVAIHGVPRSGTSWLGELINSSPSVCYKYQPLFSYRFKGALTPQSDRKNIEDFFGAIARTADDFMDQVENRSKGILPTFLKRETSHVVYKEVRYHHILENLVSCSDTKLVLIIRNPVEALGSWLQAPREFRKDQGWDIATEWRHANLKNQGKPEEYYGFEKWKEASILFLHLASAYPGQVILVEYRNLLLDTEKELGRIFNFLGLVFSEQTQSFLANSAVSSNSDAYSVYRDRNEAIRSRDGSALPQTIASEITAELRGTSLERFLYLQGHDKLNHGN